MKRVIDIDAILAPIPGENPAGEDLRYTPTYEEIKEARRADDPFDRGSWQYEIKKSDWDKVQTLAVEALTKNTKDLQIAAWLTEALVTTDGFDGLGTGLKIITGLLRDYWGHVYPLIEEGDIEFRAAPLEFLNDKLWPFIKQVPITDTSVSQGYSWLKWQESREVGYEADTKNQYGDVDESKKRKHDEMITEGKLSAEDFDSAVALSPKAFYESISAKVNACREDFKRLDEIVDEKFGSQAPRLAELGGAIEDCAVLILKLLKQKGGVMPTPETEAVKELPKEERLEERPVEAEAVHLQPTLESTSTAFVISPAAFTDTDSQVNVLWEEALQTLKTSGITKALKNLLEVCYRAPSIRERSRCRLLVAKLCLRAERPDLARPVIEELFALIEELHLDRWESPSWIAEVIDILYQCLTQGESSDEDIGRAKSLFQRLCITDITKAVIYRN